MLTVEEALALVLDTAAVRPAQQVRLNEALGLCLAQDVVSDVNSPPHDKAMVDGYALRADELASGFAELAVLEEVTAGDVPRRAVMPGSATRIMTGAPLPENANAVVMVERTEMVGDRVQIREPDARAGMNIMRLGTSLRKGDVVLTAGHVLRPIDIGLLSEVGCTRMLAVPRPSVAILATGNELVPPRALPEAGKIRNSNGPLLTAAVTAAGATPLSLGIARDEPQELTEKIAAGLARDVLLLTGGVSAGQLDLVPPTLEQLGVRKIFHKIRLKPGKPLWFGVKEDEYGRRLVFGLPGNPVSAFVCFQLFVRPALARLAGQTDVTLSHLTATLTRDHAQRGDRTTYFPALLDHSTEPPQVTPVPWHGSADLRGFSTANALLHFPPGPHTYPAGTQLQVLPLE